MEPVPGRFLLRAVTLLAAVVFLRDVVFLRARLGPVLLVGGRRAVVLLAEVVFFREVVFLLAVDVFLVAPAFFRAAVFPRALVALLAVAKARSLHDGSPPASWLQKSIFFSRTGRTGDSDSLVPPPPLPKRPYKILIWPETTEFLLTPCSRTVRQQPTAADIYKERGSPKPLVNGTIHHGLAQAVTRPTGLRITRVEFESLVASETSQATPLRTASFLLASNIPL